MKNKGLLTIVVVFGVLFGIFFLFVMLVLGSVDKDLSVTGEGIGVVEITGPIMESKRAVETLRRYAKNDRIKGILIRIDSPGGAVAPSQEIYQAVLRAKTKKKVYVSMGSTAASGGYYIACAADRIYANPGSVTGSIGVITQLTNFAELAELAKVDVVTIKSGAYKDVGNPFREFSEQDRRFFQQMVMDIYDQFVQDVATARGMKLDEVKAVADGRVFTGQQAQKLGLVDELGGLHAAAEGLGKALGLEGDPELIYPPKEEDDVLKKLLESSIQGATEGVTRGLRESAAAPPIEYRYVGPGARR